MTTRVFTLRNLFLSSLTKIGIYILGVLCVISLLVLGALILFLLIIVSPITLIGVLLVIIASSIKPFYSKE